MVDLGFRCVLKEELEMGAGNSLGGRHTSLARYCQK